ncbi:unnamed protein product, partial [Ectocarpus sp. 12 AP-2014]
MSVILPAVAVRKVIAKECSVVHTSWRQLIMTQITWSMPCFYLMLNRIPSCQRQSIFGEPPMTESLFFLPVSCGCSDFRTVSFFERGQSFPPSMATRRGKTTAAATSKWFPRVTRASIHAMVPIHQRAYRARKQDHTDPHFFFWSSS